MKRIISICLAVLCMLSFACQPTPEVEPVPNKGDFTLEQQIEEARKTPAPQSSAQTTESESTAATAPQPIIIPDRWEDSIQAGGWNIPIDAEIIAEQKDSYPVYIVKKKVFTEEEFDRIANAFFHQDVITGVCYESLWCWYPNEEEYKKALERAVMAHRDDWADYLLNHKEVIEREYIPADRIECLLDENGAYHTYVKYINSKGEEETGYALVEENRFQCMRKINCSIEQPAGIREDWGYFDYEEPMLQNLHSSVTLQEAIDVAEDFFARAGIEGFVYTSAEEDVYASHFLTEIYNTGLWLEFNNPFGYEAYQTSRTDGNGPFQFDSIQVSRPWDFHNYIKVLVTDEGIEELWWSGPLDATETVDGLNIMPVEEAEGCIKRLLTYGLPQHYGDIAMKVTKLLLGSAMQPMKDNQDLVYLVPAWVCEIEVYNINPRTGVADETPCDTLYYSFSAIDGTYLDWRP